MPAFPTKSPPFKFAITYPTGLSRSNPLLRHVNRQDAYTGDAIVRQEFGFTDVEGLEDVTINHYGPGTNQAISSIFVPVAGGPNSDAAVTLASSIASEWAASITLLTVIPEGATDNQRQVADQRLDTYAEMVADSSVVTTLVRSDDVVPTIAKESVAHELLVIGASERSLFKRFFGGTIPEQLGQETHAPIFVISQ
ncbi:universal stress protein [Halobacterium sp. R2-5]|uniref:universal stress protein n=1 Tax=Halobacterium sp. R2-5 TaxID=2715751 RepID=UPI001421929F|nr:universal stress protein [Halobacterium sp. R2-5]NIC00987.1 universal stress protein [Halobacterium sp. R2-5]